MEVDKTPPILRDLPDALAGERVIVRPYQVGDGLAMFEAVVESREHLRTFMPWESNHKTAQDSETIVRRAAANWLTREDLMVGVWERESGRYLGGSGLHRMDWDVPSFEIGYWLRQTAVGHGYMTETVQLLCRMAFDTLGANRVFIRCAAANTRSAAIPRRLGFVHEATLRNYTREPSGALRDDLIFAMTPEDYANAPWRSAT